MDCTFRVGGEAYGLPSGSEERAELLCGARPLDRENLDASLADEGFAAIVLDAILRGYLAPVR